MSAFEVAFRPVLLNALNVVNEMPAPEDANLGKLADRLMEIMFSRQTDSVTVPTVTEPVKEKKPRKSKKTEVAAEVAAEAAPAEPTAEPVKEKKPRKSKKAEETPLPASDAEAEKPKKEKKAKKEGVNIEKLTPTQMKLLKPIADELKTEIDKVKLLEHLNAMTPEDFASKTIYEHYRALVAPAEPEERDSIVVDFNAKTYYVTPDDKKVWEETSDGVHKFVGHVGMAAFADMKIPENA